MLVTARDDTHLHVKALVQAYHEQGTVCVQDYTYTPLFPLATSIRAQVLTS